MSIASRAREYDSYQVFPANPMERMTAPLLPTQIAEPLSPNAISPQSKEPMAGAPMRKYFHFLSIGLEEFEHGSKSCSYTTAVTEHLYRSTRHGSGGEYHLTHNTPTPLQQQGTSSVTERIFSFGPYPTTLDQPSPTFLLRISRSWMSGV